MTTDHIRKYSFPLAIAAFVCVISLDSFAQTPPEWKPVESALGRTGKVQPDGPLKFGMPRKDEQAEHVSRHEASFPWYPGHPEVLWDPVDGARRRGAHGWGAPEVSGHHGKRLSPDSGDLRCGMSWRQGLPALLSWPGAPAPGHELNHDYVRSRWRVLPVREQRGPHRTRQKCWAPVLAPAPDVPPSTQSSRFQACVSPV